MIISAEIKTNSKNNKITLLDENLLKIYLKATPIEGKANKALIKYLAKELKSAASLIEIKKGLNSHKKTLEINITESHWKTFLEKLSKEK